MERRVLVLAPRGRDADVVSSVLAGGDLVARICNSVEALLAGLSEGAGAAIATEEALALQPDHPLLHWVAQQPSWSDFPFIVLTARRAGPRPPPAQAALQALGNLVLLERPVTAETLGSTAEAAVRARRRQYTTRRHLQELHEARATVERLNRGLEDRIAARTRELAGANDRLMAEIAERERAQSTLVQMQKMEAIGRLTGGMAHDFNNLLHVVSMNLELLTRLGPGPQAAAAAALAKRAVNRGSRLTSQLLSFARAQSLLPRLSDINALLQGMQDLVAVSVGAAVQLRLELCDGPAWAWVDPSQMEMAVLNLALNAKDAMAGGGRLTLASRVADVDDPVPQPDGQAAGPVGRCVVVSVADEGPGIPEYLLSKVFDPFFTTKPLGSGTGLGLSQVYGFAQQSGGLARIASALGRGTVVEICLPVAPAPPAETPAEAPGVALPIMGKHRILVVEDDTDVRRVIVESLQLAGHHVTAAADGPLGLAALQHEAPDLLIADYAMPGMNGAEVIHKAHELLPDLPVILATGYADMAEVGRVLGTQSILSKPFDIATLLKAVSHAMQPPGSPQPVAPEPQA
jgi:signal transduction histidine kinase/ActR/RegA family two-component response regulator